MKTSRVPSCAIAVFAVAALGTSSAQAVVFAPGDILALPGTTSALEPQLAGTVIEDDTVRFSFVSNLAGGITNGSIQERVIRSSVDNTLDFYWRVSVTGNSASALTALRIGDFTSPEMNANWRSDSLDDRAPDQGHRFTAALTESFNYLFGNNLLAPGEVSFFMFMDTTATSYAKTAIMDVSTQDFGSQVFSTFEPAVPAPASAVLLGLGAISMGRRRSR